MAKEDRALRPDERIAGTNYVVIQYESGGGHGSLYRVRHYELVKRIYALKLLHADLCSNTDLAVRMRREAQILSGMSHPNIVNVYDAGTTQEIDPDTHQTLVRPFFTMDWLKGRSLATILAGVHGMGIGLHDALEIGIEVSDALDYAHTRHGVIHRDIKPDNVFLQAAAERHGKTVTRLLDFGVAAVLGAEKITRRPTVLGTPRYASPEQLRGEPPTPQTDLYGLGLLLHEMLVGYGPFDDAYGLSAMMRAHLHTPAAPLPSRDFPDAIVHLVASCLEKKPGDRPPSASEVGRRLREIKFKAEERRTKNLAALSKTDPTPVASAIIAAGREPTDPGSPTGAAPLDAFDITAVEEAPAQHPIGSIASSSFLVDVSTQVDALPFGAQAQASNHKTATDSVASLIDRLAITRTIPPDTPRRHHGTGTGTEAIALPSNHPTLPPPPFIGGAPVFQMGDRYVMDPDSITPPVPPPPRLGPPRAMTTTGAANVSMSARGRSDSSARSLRSLLRLQVPRHYAALIGAVGLLGMIVILLLGSARLRALRWHDPPPTSLSSTAHAPPPASTQASLPVPTQLPPVIPTAVATGPVVQPTATAQAHPVVPTVATSERTSATPHGARPRPKPPARQDVGEFRTTF